MDGDQGFEIVPVQAIDSPCVGTCRIGADGLCDGCHRTLAEIGSWTSGTSAWRSAVLAARRRGG